MKPTAVLVNVARAEIVDADGLSRALTERTIAGAALDVWYRYPTEAGATRPAHQPFHELPNVLMTPHVSGWTQGMREARAKVIAENIHRTARGETPVNLIPPDGVRVSVACSYPLLTWGGRPLVPVPMSVRRWFSAGA